MPEPLSVFISYSHDDETLREGLETHLAQLRRDGWIDVWHDRKIPPGSTWEGEIDRHLEGCDLVLLLVSPDFLASDYCYQKEMKRALARQTEGSAVVVPILLRPCDWQSAPLAELQSLPRDDKPITTWDDTDAGWNEVVQELRNRLQDMRDDREAEPDNTAPYRPEPRVEVGRLPTTSSTFVGRDAELDRLDAAWRDPGTHVLSIVAFGGFGKTALVDAWLDRLRDDHWRGARRVFAWSFYSQGTSRDESTHANASADPFFDAALDFFGYRGEPIQGPSQRAEILARLVRQRRTLLLLDGLEPMQFAPLEGERTGRLRDSALAILLKELAYQSRGLCLITTRVEVWDLEKRRRSSAPVYPLQKLSDEAGAALLRDYGIDGSEKQLRQASADFGGHALALTLLATYLRDFADGDVRKREDFRPLDDDIEGAGHARRVMVSYEEQLGPAERRVLRLLGLFDRPAGAAELAALRAEPEVESLTDGVGAGEERAWKAALARLRRARLVLEAEGDAEALDAHPLVREHFGEQLRQTAPEAWREGHRRLYEHYRTSTDELPETLEAMLPLYAAVVHGCRAERWQEAFQEIFRDRIHRGGQFYSQRQLGAFSSDLMALAALFERPWDRPASALSPADQAWLLNEAGFELRALGRLPEAVAPMEAGMQRSIDQKDWKNAGARASNLSELLLTLGRVVEAVAAGARGVELADRSGDPFLRVGLRTTHADALHQAGQIQGKAEEASAARFAEAEAMQAEWQPQYPRLYSLQGYRYCDLLLTRLVAEGESAPGQLVEVRQRAEEALDWMENHFINMGLLGISLGYLTLGRVHLLAGDLTESATALERAVAGLRQAGTEHNLPWGLLARAALHRTAGAFHLAQHDLDEVLEIAQRGAMRLHEADAWLELARLRWARGEGAGAREALGVAKGVVEKVGYGRRVPEVARLEETLNEGSG